MQLAFSTLGCPAWSLDQILAFAAAHGYAAVELRGLGEHVDLRLSPPFSPARRAATRRHFADAGLTVCCASASASFADPAKRHASLDEVRAYVELAADLGCPRVRVFGGSPPPGQEDEETVAGVADCLAELGPFAGAHGVTLVLETHDAFSTGARVARVLERVEHAAVGALWDLHHPFRHGEDPVETARLLAPWLAHLHVKDSREGRYCLLGEGDVPVGEMLRLVRESRRAGDSAGGVLPARPDVVCVEWEKRWHPDIAEPEEALAQYARALRALLAEEE